jgi:uncharacterized Rmd1/YagE family protein
MRVAESEARLAAEAYNMRAQQDRVTVQAAVAQAEQAARRAAAERDMIIANASKEAANLREYVQRLEQQLRDSQRRRLLKRCKTFVTSTKTSLREIGRQLTSAANPQHGPEPGTRQALRITGTMTSVAPLLERAHPAVEPASERQTALHLASSPAPGVTTPATENSRER